MRTKNFIKQTGFVMALFGLLVTSSIAKAAHHKPEEVVQGLADGVYALMTNTKQMTANDQFVRIVERIDDYYHIRLMAQTIAGPAWGKAPAAEQKAFVDLFRHYMAAEIAHDLQTDYYKDAKFKIDSVTDGPQGTKLVNSQVFIMQKNATARERNRPDDLRFVVKKISGQYYIVDIIRTGTNATISDLKSMKDEFNSVANRKGITGLEEALEIKINQLRTNTVPTNR